MHPQSDNHLESLLPRSVTAETAGIHSQTRLQFTTGLSLKTSELAEGTQNSNFCLGKMTNPNFKKIHVSVYKTWIAGLPPNM